MPGVKGPTKGAWYRKKPVEVWAWEFDPTDKEMVAYCGAVEKADGWMITTLEGDMLISPGDYIIEGVEGEHYPCKPSIFFKSYEAIKPSSAP